MYLQQIVASKKLELAQKKDQEDSTEDLLERANRLPPPRCFKSALTAESGPAIIAEIKRASPSKGTLSSHLCPKATARKYQQGGASAISVLTEQKHFQGSLRDLKDAQEAVDLPILRKDFIFDPRQVVESRLVGADALLLIAGILSPFQLRELITLAENLGMQCLVETATPVELDQAVKAGGKIIGINNRSLQTFHTDLTRSFQLASQAPPGTILVAESGISHYWQIKELHQLGFKAALVGEALICTSSPEQKLRELRGVEYAGQG